MPSVDERVKNKCDVTVLRLFMQNVIFCLHVLVWSSALGAVALGGKVYICGGFDGMSSLNSVEMYDPETDEWTMVSSMEKHRSAAGVVVLDNQIYAIGGHDGLSIFDSVSLFSFSFYILPSMLLPSVL